LSPSSPETCCYKLKVKRSVADWEETRNACSIRDGTFMGRNIVERPKQMEG
jgi:hypothetical protein